MRTILESAFLQVKRNPVMTVIIALQVLVCTVVFTKISGVMQNHLEEQRMAEASFRTGAYVAWQADDARYSNYLDKEGGLAAYNRHVEQTAAQALDAPGVETVIPVGQAFGMSYTRGDGLGFYVNNAFYSPELLAELDIPLSQGSLWDTNKTYTLQDEIPVVISPTLAAHMPLGSVTKLMMGGDMLGRYNSRLAAGQRVALRVVGVLGRRNMSWDFSDMSRPITDWIAYEDATILMPTLQVPDDQSFVPYQCTGALVKFAPGAQQQVQQFIAGAQEASPVAADMDALRAASNASIYMMLQSDLITFGIMFVIALIGIGGNNTLIRQYNEKQYGVYFMSGANWRKCVWIDAVRNLFIVLPAGALGLLLQFRNYANDPLQPFLLNGYTVLAVFGMLLLIYLCSSLIFILRTRRSKPIDIIRRWE
nr:hypothetical protein [Maliibacterium massiliense]